MKSAEEGCVVLELTTDLHVIASSELLHDAACSEVPHSQCLVLAGLQYCHLTADPLQLCHKVAWSGHYGDGFPRVCVPQTYRVIT